MNSTSHDIINTIAQLATIISPVLFVAYWVSEVKRLNAAAKPKENDTTTSPILDSDKKHKYLRMGTMILCVIVFLLFSQQVNPTDPVSLVFFMASIGNVLFSIIAFRFSQIIDSHIKFIGFVKSTTQQINEFLEWAKKKLKKRRRKTRK